MNDEKKTKEQLINELGELRQRITELEKSKTEWKRTEKELIEVKDFLLSIIEGSKDGILIVDEKGYIVSVNTALEEMSGFSREEMIGKHASIFSSTEDKELRKKILEKINELYEKGNVSLESVFKRKDGKLVAVECNESLIKDKDGNYIAGVSIFRDITERKKAAKEIKEARDFLRSVIEGSKDGILIVDEKGYIVSVNSAIEQITDFKKEELIGKHTSILTTKDKEVRKNILEKTAELFEKGSATYESVHNLKDGRNINVECISSLIKDDQGTVIAGVSIIRDTSERKIMEQQLLQSEKLKSLGELSGGVAHDFNNILAAILGRVQLLKMQLKPPLGKQKKRKSLLELKKSLEIIERASLDGAETVRRIQEFSRRSVDDKVFTQVSINELIDDALEFTRVRWKNEAESKGIKIRIKKELSPLAPALASPSELREVFTNLINNAIDVMPQGGEIRVESFMDDTTAVIRISDTGNGIHKDIKDRVFDPFFTTKGVQSSGLGLSVSYGIINRHRGTITVDSVEGEGTTFTIKFPITKKTDKRKVKEAKVIPIKREQKKARILVIEDEEDVRMLLRDILTYAGHDVEIANDGSEGIEMFEKKEFDLVFTDLGMPGISGWQVAEKVKTINGRVPVVLITGWNIALEGSEINDNGINFVIHKPFKMEQVLNLVQEGMQLRDQLKAV